MSEHVLTPHLGMGGTSEGHFIANPRGTCPKKKCNTAVAGTEINSFQAEEWLPKVIGSMSNHQTALPRIAKTTS